MVTRDEFKEKISYKLDLAMFKEYQKKEMESRSAKDKEFKL